VFMSGKEYFVAGESDSALAVSQSITAPGVAWQKCRFLTSIDSR